jgi:hypothetical protein
VFGTTQIVHHQRVADLENNEEPTKAHALNSVESVRPRNTKRGHRDRPPPTSIAVLGNIAMKTGKKLRRDTKKEDFVGESDRVSAPDPNLRKPRDLIKL